jgi:hypothetical protein
MTLLVYDTTGVIQRNVSGSYIKPVGIPYLEVEIPSGRYAISVDVTKTPHVAVLSDPPVDEKEVAIADLQNRMLTNEDLNLKVLEAMAEVYEMVYPFLPQFSF